MRKTSSRGVGTSGREINGDGEEFVYKYEYVSVRARMNFKFKSELKLSKYRKNTKLFDIERIVISTEFRKIRVRIQCCIDSSRYVNSICNKMVILRG